MRRFCSNLAHASLHGTGHNFVSNKSMSAQVFHLATNYIWFQRFMQGMHQQMGNVWLLNRALSQYELTDCFQILDSKWDVAQIEIVDRFKLKRTVMTACILLAGYFASGFEGNV